jgi:hypothetical protein
VTLADLSTEKRYTCNGAVTADQDPLDVLLDLRESMAGHISDCGGKWVIHAGAWRTPTLTLTDADMCGPFRMVPRLSRSDNFNGVRGLYFAPENQWAPADFPAVKNDTYMGWDGGKRLWKDVAYNFCTSPARAQRLAKIDLERGRQQIVFSADYMLKAMQCRPGDVIMVTRARQGWSAKYFEVDEWRLVIEGDDQGQPVMKIGLAVRETAEAVYDWNDGEETTVDLAPNTTLLDARTVATPAGLTLSTSNFLQPDGTITPRLRVQWTAAAAVQVSNGGAVRIEYKKASSSDWLEWSRIRGDLAEDYITDVEAGIGYNVRLQFISVFGVRGAYASASATVGADASAPATPTGLTATAGTGKAVALDWGDNTDDDLAGYKIYRNTTNNAGTATYIASVSASAFVDATVAVSTTYYYFISAYDRTGNESAKTSGVSVTTAPVVGAMTVALSTTYLSAGGSNGSTINTATMSATPSGGTGSGYTYQWTRTSGSTAIEPTQSTSRFTAFVASGGTDEVFNATFKCTVTDSASNTADSFENVSVDITFGTPP